ncbi:MAG: hypothetical protein H0X17_01600, partial [Deltaproteobacteria bacterium]|nr:hypothetical protein [Deltaproteobacteria bacterium]
MITQAVLLATGGTGDEVPALARVAGLTILKRMVLTLGRGGITRITVVAARAVATLRSAIDGDADYAKAGLAVEVVASPE